MLEFFAIEFDALGVGPDAVVVIENGEFVEVLVAAAGEFLRGEGGIEGGQFIDENFCFAFGVGHDAAAVPPTPKVGDGTVADGDFPIFGENLADLDEGVALDQQHERGLPIRREGLERRADVRFFWGTPVEEGDLIVVFVPPGPEAAEGVGAGGKAFGGELGAHFFDAGAAKAFDDFGLSFLGQFLER